MSRSAWYTHFINTFAYSETCNIFYETLQYDLVILKVRYALLWRSSNLWWQRENLLLLCMLDVEVSKLKQYLAHRIHTKVTMNLKRKVFKSVKQRIQRNDYIHQKPPKIFTRINTGMCLLWLPTLFTSMILFKCERKRFAYMYGLLYTNGWYDYILFICW